MASNVEHKTQKLLKPPLMIPDNLLLLRSGNYSYFVPNLVPSFAKWFLLQERPKRKKTTLLSDAQMRSARTSGSLFLDTLMNMLYKERRT